MKKLGVFLIAIMCVSIVFAQEGVEKKKKVISETTKKKFNIGLDVFTDIMMDLPDGMETRTINQGANVFGMYNYHMGRSNFSLAAGIGLGMHNIYSNTTIEDIKADTINFVPIPDDISYKRSKISLTYLDIPVEIRFKSKNQFRMAVGFKLGYLLDAKTKYKGNRFDGSGHEVITKEKEIDHVETLRFGPTFRIGYKWINLYGYYSATKIFRKNKGPEMIPVSVGITLMPF